MDIGHIENDFRLRQTILEVLGVKDDQEGLQPRRMSMSDTLRLKRM
jgi:hypothetical protein